MNERKELIARLRECHATTHTRAIIDAAADMLEADAQPQYGWLTACDEEMIVANIGVAELSDSFESAKQKLGELIAWHVAVATDPAVNGGLSLQPAVPQEPKCSEHPDAPHGFNRTASHTLDRYVCECEGWVPDNAEVSGPSTRPPY